MKIKGSNEYKFDNGGKNPLLFFKVALVFCTVEKANFRIHFGRHRFSANLKINWISATISNCLGTDKEISPEWIREQKSSGSRWMSPKVIKCLLSIVKLRSCHGCLRSISEIICCNAWWDIAAPKFMHGRPWLRTEQHENSSSFTVSSNNFLIHFFKGETETNSEFAFCARSKLEFEFEVQYCFIEKPACRLLWLSESAESD